MNKSLCMVIMVIFFGISHFAYASTTHYLKATNFGFSIPTGSTINGIQVEVEKKCNASSQCADNSIKIVKGGTISGTEMASSTFWSTTNGYVSYGGTADLWGLSWTPADINSSAFGAAISANLQAQGTTAFIDHIRISVTYTPPDAPTVTTSAADTITSDSANINGTITDDGGVAASTCGFVWGSSATLSGGDTSTTSDSACPGTIGSFVKALSALSANVTYYFRAYATNVTGTGYGSILSFTTDIPPRILRLTGGVRLMGGIRLR